ncbi:MAG: hypothetical protein AB7E24_05930 [Novosphingobium sp.]
MIETRRQHAGPTSDALLIEQASDISMARREKPAENLARGSPFKIVEGRSTWDIRWQRFWRGSLLHGDPGPLTGLFGVGNSRQVQDTCPYTIVPPPHCNQTEVARFYMPRHDGPGLAVFGFPALGRDAISEAMPSRQSERVEVEFAV